MKSCCQHSYSHIYMTENCLRSYPLVHRANSLAPNDIWEYYKLARSQADTFSLTTRVNIIPCLSAFGEFSTIRESSVNWYLLKTKEPNYLLHICDNKCAESKKECQDRNEVIKTMSRICLNDSLQKWLNVFHCMGVNLRNKSIFIIVACF